MSHVFVCDVAQSSDVLCVADTCCDVDIAEVVLLWRRFLTCCDVFFCEAIILTNMLRSMVAMFLFSTKLSLFPNRADFYVPPSKDADVSAFV